MNKKIKCLLVKPNEEPEVVEVENTLKALQGIVNGYIQAVPLSKTSDLICNEEGKLLGLEPNRPVGDDLIMGNFIIVGNDGSGEFVSLSEENIEKYKSKFALKIADMYITKCFISNLNDRFTEMKLDLNELSESYVSEDKLYMKEVLRQMHQAFIEAAGTDDLGELAEAGEDFITLPAIIQAEDTGEMCLGLIDIDLSSSGEHWNTTFMTKYGIYDYDREKADTPAQKEIGKFFPHRYYYTPTYDGDIHIRGEKPKEIQEVLDYAKLSDTALEQAAEEHGMEEIK